jgi:hypothetical protein
MTSVSIGETRPDYEASVHTERIGYQPSETMNSTTSTRSLESHGPMPFGDLESSCDHEQWDRVISAITIAPST